MDQDTRELLLGVLAVVGTLLGATIGGIMARSGALEALREQFAEEKRRSTTIVKHRVLHDVTSMRRVATTFQQAQRIDSDGVMLLRDEASMITTSSDGWRDHIVQLEDVELETAVIDWYSRIRMKVGWTTALLADCAHDIATKGQYSGETGGHLMRLTNATVLIALQGEVLIRKLGMVVPPMQMGPLPGDGVPEAPA